MRDLRRRRYDVQSDWSKNTGKDRLITQFFVEISIIKLSKLCSLRILWYKGALIHKPTIIVKMLLGKVVCFVFILTQTVLATEDVKETFPPGSCGWQTFVSYNPNRIPIKITETVCLENSGFCGMNDANAKYFLNKQRKPGRIECRPSKKVSLRSRVPVLKQKSILQEILSRNTQKRPH